MKSFESYFKKLPPEQSKALLATIKEVERLYPKAVRTYAWGMPTLMIGEDYLCHIEGFKKHNSLFPSSGSISELLEAELKNFKVSKGTIQFEMDKAFPKTLLKKILAARLNQLNESYPKKNGDFVEYYKDGGVKARGKYQGAQMHGAWEFYRVDGSLMRSGSFKNGEQYGEWTTFTATGKVVKVTNFK